MSFEDFCREYSGVTRRAVNSLLHGSEPMHGIFFQPYDVHESKNPFFRAATIVTAPICSAIFALQTAVMAVNYLCKSILSLAKMEFGASSHYFKESGKCLLGMCINLLLSPISPVVNLVDLIGGGVATVFDSKGLSTPANSFF
mgnify:CR=1 FL=1